MKLITVFTPSYNRAYCLDQVYNSLVNQTNQNFKWLIIDDGSTDNTKELIQSWMNEAKIEIQYIYQENQGMHGGHNTAYKNIDTELNVCIDSDDYMPLDAIEKIAEFWKNNKRTDVAGIIALDSYKNGEVIGEKIPEDIQLCTLSELHQKRNVNGDKKLILRTEIVKKYPLYPLFQNERFVPLGTLYYLIDQDYQLIVLNEVVCIVEYLADGSSKNILRQYKKNPNGFVYSRLLRIRLADNFKEKFKNSVHLVSSCIFAKNTKMFSNNNEKLILLLAFPFGILLNIYIRFKTFKA